MKTVLHDGVPSNVADAHSLNQ